jgi:hypothetical protein
MVVAGLGVLCLLARLLCDYTAREPDEPEGAPGDRL